MAIPYSVKTGCKINLGLNITERRPDGYHNLETIFYPVPLFDELTICENGKEDDQEKYYGKQSGKYGKEDLAPSHGGAFFHKSSFSSLYFNIPPYCSATTNHTYHHTYY